MPDYVRIASVIDDSIVDGPGIRMTIFFQGCAHGKCLCNGSDPTLNFRHWRHAHS